MSLTRTASSPSPRSPRTSPPPLRDEPDATNHFRFNRNGTLAELRKICNHPFLIPAVHERLNTEDTDLLVRTSGKFDLLDVRCCARRCMLSVHPPHTWTGQTHSASSPSCWRYGSR
jgi:hypothetical protein